MNPKPRPSSKNLGPPANRTADGREFPPPPPRSSLFPVLDEAAGEPVTDKSDGGPKGRRSPRTPPSPAKAPNAASLGVDDGTPVVLASPASLWRRCLALTFDLALLSSIVLGLLAAATLIIAPKGAATLTQRLLVAAIPGAVLAAMFGLVYTTLFGFLLKGRTPGRFLLGIRLVDHRGRTPGMFRALFRGILSLFSFAIFLAGFWISLFDRRGQTLHDKLSRTFVVRLETN
jgi:uncharacterized RDD family membrane protein YckC